jgi:antirestriction protein/transcriptional regulator with XRE-family HTH domain
VNPEHGAGQQPDPEVEPAEQPRIYVASLSDYNAGRLHGSFIRADQPADEIHEAIKAMLARSPESGAEEWAIHDYDGFYGLHLSEYESIEHVVTIGQGIAEHGPAFAAWAGLLGSGQWDEDLHRFEDCYRGEWTSLTAYAEDLLEDLMRARNKESTSTMKPEQIQAIGAFLRTQREAMGLTLRDLEELSGVGNSVIARFESGFINRPDPNKLARLSRALGVSLNEVLAAGDVTSGADLPAMPVYLRSRYEELPEEAIEQMNRYFDRLARKHGIDPAGPKPGEDEASITKRNRAR